MNSVPTTEAPSRTRRSAGARRSRRAPMSAWIVAGIGTSARSDAATQRPPCHCSTPSSTRMATSSSRKSGCPSPASRIRSRTSGVDLLRPEQVVDELRALLAAERGQREVRRVHPPAPPARPLLRELGPREADHQEWHVPGGAGQVRDEVEQRLLRPVDVVEDHDERPVACHGLEEPADRPEDLVGDRRDPAEAEDRGDLLLDEPGVLDLPDEPGHLGARLLGLILIADLGGLPDHLGDRPEGEVAAVGEAVAAQDGRALAHRVEELGDEPRLPDARRSEQGDHGGRSFPRGPHEHLAKHGQLLRSPHQRRGEPAADGSEQRGLDEPEGRLRSVLGAEQEELGGLEARRPPNEPGRGSAQEHLADPCRSRELIGLVDRPHGQKALLVLRELDEHLAEGDPDSQVELRPLGGVRSGRPEAELGRGSYGSNGVVLMDPGDSEDGADPSDHHLVHPAAVALDDRQRLLHR